MDPVAFYHPQLVDSHRPISSFMVHAHWLHFCFGAPLVAPALDVALKGGFQPK